MFRLALSFLPLLLIVSIWLLTLHNALYVTRSATWESLVGQHVVLFSANGRISVEVLNPNPPPTVAFHWACRTYHIDPAMRLYHFRWSTLGFEMVGRNWFFIP